MDDGPVTPRRDSVDHHVARWAEYWEDNPHFDPQVEGAVTRMQTIITRLKRVNATAFAGSKFTLEDYLTLHALMVQPFPTEATPAQLAEMSQLTRAGMTSRLDRLADAGLITREGDSIDRRRVIVRPTPAGRAAWDRYVHEGMTREQRLLAALNPNELAQLNRLLRKVVLALDET